ncbi:MAG: class I SAM-dependent methyltransferase [Mariprofundaceae bacterium]|nr:class I SAM-dependent methyltransferase [Mariprofundaceae bacterium]
MKTQHQCDLCHSGNYKNVSNQDRHGRKLYTGICLQCGLLSHIPVPSEEEIIQYYAVRYRKDYHGSSKPIARRIMRAHRNAERIFTQLKPHMKPKQTVFEVGAGIGCTVKFFEQQGLEASGIEPNKDFNVFTRQELHADVRNENLYDLNEKADYDVTLLIHVIEHFTSPTRALKHIYGLIKDDGLLYIECPNATAPFGRLSKMFHFAHIYNFSPKTLIAMAQKCGFVVENIFSDDNNPNLQILFKKSTAQEQELDETHANWVLERIHYHTYLSYHLRPCYLKARITKLLSYGSEYLLARGFVKKFLASCQEKPTKP